MNTDKQTLSITEYITLLNEQLKLYSAKIIGEVTQVKTWPSGHVYFTLKDKEQGAVLDCVMWKNTYELFGLKIETGMELIAVGSANIYPPSGRLSFIAKSIELVGEGALKKAYDALKQKLTSEGFFSPERKRQIPKYPKRIGIITSKQGAVIHDFINNCNKHGFKITFINSKVEGQEALPDLYNAIRTIKKEELDVIVIMRGGGSLQSLAAFDSEVLVREIATTPVPVIAAIGHHQDIPLCSLAADAMVSTPTAAANLLNKSWEDGLQSLNFNTQRIVSNYKELIKDAEFTLKLAQQKIIDKFNRVLSFFTDTTSRMKLHLSQISKSIVHTSETLDSYGQTIQIAMNRKIIELKIKIKSVEEEKIHRTFRFLLNNINEQINTNERILKVYNPLNQLALGYSLIRDNSGKLVKSIKDVKIGEILSLLTSDGSIISEVKSLNKTTTNE